MQSHFKNELVNDIHRHDRAYSEFNSNDKLELNFVKKLIFHCFSDFMPVF
jgi:hypothetical protein